MAHFVWHPGGLCSAEFDAILTLVQLKGRNWREWLAPSAALIGVPAQHHSAIRGLYARLGYKGIKQITLSGLALQLERNAISETCE